ncbi:hypothetical protein F441_18419 [Phytophthora nicotianae CJ01A1]|uniref:Uncharacterized protein n=2 Tax=Phytophthora nicotianae TaxID=4792 RepID=V9E930_PHYNI|nr:hypothetical protein F443_18562 [Phytophthora nicotianae P1569]ETP04889.1 hypothetical protein F441_18419 [Phytophthora nicotianae CJ01A1]
MDGSLTLFRVHVTVVFVESLEASAEEKRESDMEAAVNMI